jgi:hypothetical protein
MIRRSAQACCFQVGAGIAEIANRRNNGSVKNI